MRLRTIIIIGLAIRLAMAPFLAHPVDVYAWWVAGHKLLEGQRPVWSYLDPYEYSYFLFVFPATFAFAFLRQFLPNTTIPMSSLNPSLQLGTPWNVTVVPGVLFDFLVKLPLIASDTIVALLIYTLVKNQLQKEKLAIWATTIWFLNPFVIWVSSAWGMFDTFPTLFTLLTLYFVLEKKFTFAGLTFVAAVAMKYYAAVLFLPLLLISWRLGGKIGILKWSTSAAILAIALFVPLLGQVGFGFTTLLSGNWGGLVARTVPETSVHYAGLSFWTAITLFFPNFDQNTPAAVLTAALLAIVYFWIWKNRSKGDFVTIAAFFALPIYALLPAYGFIAENFFIWPLPFVIILALNRSKLRTLYWIQSAIALFSSITDSLLPYYLLPVAPWIGGYLVAALNLVTPYRVAPAGSVDEGFSVGKLILALLGLLSTAIIILIMRTVISQRNKSFDDASSGSKLSEVNVKMGSQAGLNGEPSLE